MTAAIETENLVLTDTFPMEQSGTFTKPNPISSKNGPRRLLIASQDGDVGKTAAAINLAAAIASIGGRVLIVDCNPHCGVGAALRLLDRSECREPLMHLKLRGFGAAFIDVFDGLDVVVPYAPEDRRAENLQTLLESLDNDIIKENYDFVLFDSPPSLADSVHDLLGHVSEVIVVIKAEPEAFHCLPLILETIRSAQKSNVPTLHGVLMTLPPNEPVGGKRDKELRSWFGRSLLPTAIPHDIELRKAQLHGQTLVSVNRQSPAAKEFRTLARLLASCEAGASLSESLFDGKPALCKPGFSFVARMHEAFTDPELSLPAIIHAGPPSRLSQCLKPEGDRRTLRKKRSTLPAESDDAFESLDEVDSQYDSPASEFELPEITIPAASAIRQARYPSLGAQKWMAWLVCGVCLGVVAGLLPMLTAWVP